MEFKVDARGLACPLPVVNTKKEIEKMSDGDTVKVIVDNEIAVQNLTKFAGQRNYAVESEKTGETVFEVKITVSKADGPAGENAAESEILCQPDVRKRGQLVVISGNTMGTGDDRLGKNLMKAFVFALTQQDRLPECVLMYNSGAFLSCEGSESLADLKKLEAEGVEILTCGTCLNFYGLTEKLAVGSVTNMYDIVEHMQKAGEIIRP